MTHPFPPDETRYSRQILFPGIGPQRQALLTRAHVAIVGVGATGAATASLLARAGVGHITLIDRDFVEHSNLQRQILFDEADARDALPKAEAARRKIALFNSAVTVHAHITDLIPANIHALLAPAHLLLDCTDNYETRYLLNDYAVQQSRPWIYAAAVGAYAATMNIFPTPNTHSPKAPSASASTEKAGRSPLPTARATACLACLFPTPPSGTVETCDTAGILSMAVNLAASIQSTEALKFLTGQPELLRRTLYTHDLWLNQHSEINTSTPRKDCKVCRQRIFDHLNGQSRPHITLCGRNSVQIHEHHRPIDLPQLHHILGQNPELEDLRATPHLLRFRRGPQTITLFPDGRALIQGTTDPTLARSLYARFIGS